MTVDVVLASELKPGTYICLKTRSPLGILIRWICGSPFDHVVLYLGAGKIVQAQLTGVRTGRLSQFRNCLAVANSAEDISDRDRIAIARHGTSMAGQMYDFLALPVIALRKLGVRNKFLLGLAQRKGLTICSELVCESGASAGYGSWQCGEPEPAMVRPDELAGRHPFMRSVVWDL